MAFHIEFNLIIIVFYVFILIEKKFNRNYDLDSHIFLSIGDGLGLDFAEKSGFWSLFRTLIRDLQECWKA